MMVQTSGKWWYTHSTSKDFPEWSTAAPWFAC
eukprot:COSAG02_NODE_66402_length_255_cov_0.987179_1_plen_31_part_01